jgi:hypothetical protein
MAMESKRLKLAAHVARMEELRNAYKILVRKLDWRRRIERFRHRWEDKISVDNNM